MASQIVNLIQQVENAINPIRPWLWEVTLPEDEWAGLADFVKSHPYEHPLVTMAVVARWYRQNYRSGNTEWPLEKVNAEKLWRESGLDINRFVYRTESGNHAWQQSIYVLGGLPLRVVSGSKDGRLRKMLCSALAGETELLDRIAETGEASSAIRGSMRERHSLYWYVLDIVEGRRKGSDPAEKEFISLMFEANQEALRDKFKLEWLITNSPSSATLRRKLRVVFRPERDLAPEGKPDSHHRYLHPQRLAALGLQPNKKIEMRLRFKQGERIVHTDESPFAVWRMVNQEMGFLSWGNTDYVEIDKVPLLAFDTMEIVAVIDDGADQTVVQSYHNQDCIQVFSAGGSNQWTSRKLPQRRSAVLWSDSWQLAEGVPDQTKAIADDQGERTATLWNWKWLNNSLTLNHVNAGQTITFRNLASREQPIIKLWPDLIDYLEGGLVKVEFLEEDEDGDIYVNKEVHLPPLFHKTDIGVLTELMAKQEVCERLPYKVEWKNRQGNYQDWEENSQPNFGPVKCRLTTASRRVFLIEAIYLPALGETPLMRDLDNHEVWFGNDEILTDPLDDLQSNAPLKATIDVTFSGDGWRCVLPVWRPIRRKEVVVNGKLAQVPEGDVELPYIYHDSVTLRQWDDDGFSTFDCAALPSTKSVFGETGNQLMRKWANIVTNKVQPSVIEGKFPWIKVTLGQKRATAEDADLKFYRWGAYRGSESEPIAPVGDDWKAYGLKFQDAAIPDLKLRYRYPVNTPDQRHNIEVATLLETFNVAMKHKTYFFIFPQLALMNEDAVWDAISSKIDMEKPEVRYALHRFADEMGFDYIKITTPKQS